MKNKPTKKHESLLSKAQSELCRSYDAFLQREIERKRRELILSVSGERGKN